ncbi:hypothetical protein [Streptomyces sp. NPDC058308]|uniref:hypothetical protein n=1 Tax=Streptomyces sp. NPDC058308 TaxID=3346440 RepID=UPI0036E4177A
MRAIRRAGAVSLVPATLAAGAPAGELATTGDSRALLYGGIAVALCVLGALLLAAGRGRGD